jgi:hypothetical protein
MSDKNGYERGTRSCVKKCIACLENLVNGDLVDMGKDTQCSRDLVRTTSLSSR